MTSLVALFALTMVNPWAFTADDSLFYLVVGQHLSSGGGWTFNGLISTNGIQPLWQLLVAAVIRITTLLGSDSPAVQIRAVVLVNWMFALFALSQIWRLLGRLGARTSGQLTGVVVLAACLCGPWGMFVSEAHLVAAAIVLLLLAIERWIHSDPSMPLAVATGVAAGAMMLARLDTVWVGIVAIAVLWLLASTSSPRRRPMVVVTAATSAILVAPYLIWNYATFGSFTPISAAIKVDVTSPQFSLQGIGWFGVVILLAVWLLGAPNVMQAPRRRSWVVVWSVPTLGATLSSAFYVLFARGPFTQWLWYFIPHAVALSLTVSLLASRLIDARPSSRSLLDQCVGIACVVTAIGAVAYCYGRYVVGGPDRWSTEVRAFSTEIAEALPHGASIAAVDTPGVLAFTSGHPVIGLDGLTANFEFQRDWRDTGVGCVLDKLGIGYLISVGTIGVRQQNEQSVVIALSSWLYREPPTELHGQSPILASSSGKYVLWHLAASDHCGD